MRSTVLVEIQKMLRDGESGFVELEQLRNRSLNYLGHSMQRIPFETRERLAVEQHPVNVTASVSLPRKRSDAWQ
ncbi:hypothetical protein WT57_16570 [Burkholderia pseudomultivorans]|uniref:Uncharacterized protein n=1 Tax=Burkholderia pseudomultivorans TaxID=1207504 RepID=A0A132F3A7_9BURK|nr:hypothetical protein WT57_16570 [Burkholderia pseudomultivorans]